jgi:GNAT superfamily N-acetyltransferase
MEPPEPPVALAALESERFGVRTARAPALSAADVPAVFAFCRGHGVELLVARCSTAEPAAAHALEEHGARLMDTLLVLAHDLARPFPPPPPAVRPLVRNAGEAAGVVALARAAFAGYACHYRADPRLDERACDEVHADWAARSCRDSSVAEEVLVLAHDGALDGFLALRRNGPAEGEGVLFAVATAARGRGAGAALLAGGLAWCRESGLERMLLTTHVTNLASQRTCARLGFVPWRSSYTFHAWLAPAREPVRAAVSDRACRCP